MYDSLTDLCLQKSFIPDSRLRVFVLPPAPSKSPKCKMLCNYCACSRTIISSDLHNSLFYWRKRSNFDDVKVRSLRRSKVLLETKMRIQYELMKCLFGICKHTPRSFLDLAGLRRYLHIFASQGQKKKEKICGKRGK